MDLFPGGGKRLCSSPPTGVCLRVLKVSATRVKGKSRLQARTEAAGIPCPGATPDCCFWSTVGSVSTLPAHQAAAVLGLL